MAEQVAWSTWTLLPLAVLVIVHIAWWGFGKALPSVSFCQAVQRLQGQWLAKAVRYFSAPDLSSAGFVAAVFWPAIVLFNLLLLAQVMELFFPGGGRVQVGIFGSYTAFALVAGALFSASQTMFGLVWGESKSRSIKVTFFSLLVATIFTESGLAYYRATLLLEGEDLLAGTVVARVMALSGPGLVAAVGFVVPVAHTSAGYVAFPRFLLPVLALAVRSVGGVALFAWTAVCFVYFGFHGSVAEVPRWVQDLRRGAADLTKRAAALRVTSERIRERRRDLGRLERELKRFQAFSDLENRVRTVEADHLRNEEAWKSKFEAVKEDRKTFDNELQKLCDLSVTVETAERDVREQGNQLVARCGRLRGQIEGTLKSRWWQFWKARPDPVAAFELHRTEMDGHLSEGGAQRGALTDGCTALEKKQEEVLGIWASDGATASALAGMDSRIRGVKTASDTFPPGSPERKQAEGLFDLAHSVVSTTVSEALASARSASKEFEQDLRDASASLSGSAALDAIPTPGRVSSLGHDLLTIEASVMEAARLRAGEFKGLRRGLDQRCRTIERKPRWWFFLLDLAGWTSSSD